MATVARIAMHIKGRAVLVIFRPKPRLGRERRKAELVVSFRGVASLSWKVHRWLKLDIGLTCKQG